MEWGSLVGKYTLNRVMRSASRSPAGSFSIPVAMTASADRISSSREVLLASAPVPGVDPIPKFDL